MHTLAAFRNIHAGETIIVCGCGESLNDLAHPAQYITIGVNDVGRRFHPNYLIVVNPRSQFAGDRFHYVETSQAEYLFTQLDLGVPHPHVVKFRLGTRGGTDFSDLNVLHYTQNSPYVALCLAVHMGATRIGLIGVDFTDHHFFAKTGAHVLTQQLPTIDAQYRQLGEALRARGVEVFNLSRTSRLTAFPKMSIAECTAPATPYTALDEAPLHIVSYATTPVAGVPAILARCISARTPHNARCVWAQSHYSNGVAFDGDIQWSQTPTEAEAALAQADVVIVHNGKVEPRHQPLLMGKAIITMAHNYVWNVEPGFVKQGFPGVVVGQYQATLPEFKDWTVVPNPVPLWEEAYQPGKKDGVVTLCYTPSGKHERYPANHRLYWHAKGYDTTMRILERLAARFSLRLEVIRDRQVTHTESLAMKRRAHVVIDECVTGSYHRNSLEGLAAGCVVVNGLGLLPAVVDVLRTSAGGVDRIPFVCTSLEALESALTVLIERGAEALAAEGIRNRIWIEQHWDFTRQWSQCWLPVISQALQRAGRQLARFPRTYDAQPETEIPMTMQQVERQQAKTGVSVIVPHGGQERLPHLMATLIHLRQCQDISEIIVVEMAVSPLAEDMARRWADKYVFVYNAGAFERARALNIGTGLAEYDLLLWQDNDLLVPPPFVSHAVAEFRTRQLDYLLPYTSVRYLSETDSKEVMHGTRSPTDCKPVNILTSQRDISGGMGLVKKTFVLQYGGMPEGFRGWGAEDNAWVYKACLLGRTGITQRSDQHLYHVFHPYSGGYGGTTHIAHNPHYADNVALLNRIRTIRDPRRFLECFPPPAYHSCPWELEQRIVFLTEDATAECHALAHRIAQSLVDLYGAKVEVLSAIWLERGEEADRVWADALVLFGKTLALRLFSDTALQSLWHKALIVLDSATVLTIPEVQKLGLAGAILTADPSLNHMCQSTGLRPWSFPLLLDAELDSEGATCAFAQPLSLILGDKNRLAQSEQRTATGLQNGEQRRTLPVWLYWEGTCPEWIKACQRTVFAHASDVRLLTPETFAQLWDMDRDIDLTRLQPAHRADFIRAFLLVRYGGLWIDSDCLVMKPLYSLLDALWDHDFIGHRERSHYVPNGFIGARPGSQIAAAFYHRICAILRSGQPLGWISLGGQPLTDIINTSGVPWYEIECERIQPICWSNPEAFFAVRDHREHEQVFNDRAICYMLSNTSIQQYQATHPQQNLLNEGTFFHYLVHKALKEDEPVMPSIQTIGYTHCWQLIPFCLEALRDTAPRRVLDVGIGLGRWGLLIRECLEEQKSLSKHENWQCYVEGIGLPLGGGSEHLRPFYNGLHSGDIAALLSGMTDHWDVAIFGSTLPQWSRETAGQVLHKALEFSDYVLVSLPLTHPQHEYPNEAHPSDWSLGDLLSLDPVRYATEEKPQGHTQGAFLLSRTDPKHLRQTTAMEQVFTRIFQSNLQVGDESVSGPGSCLAHTAEIRQRIPLLIENLQIHSLLDIPCGDFYWMQRMVLKVDKYVGADIIPELIQQNRQRYGSPHRTFLKLDITRDHLPQVDLILCRDCLVHFSFHEVFSALRNFKRSQSTYLLATTFTSARPNKEIATGDWRPLNLQLPPFNLPKPLRVINEKCTEVNGIYADKSLGLWRLEDLPL